MGFGKRRGACASLKERPLQFNGIHRDRSLSFGKLYAEHGKDDFGGTFHRKKRVYKTGSVWSIPVRDQGFRESFYLI